MQLNQDARMDKWNEICYILSENISQNASEEVFELKVIQALEKLGWSQFKNDLIVRQSIQIGSSRTIEPDIVVKFQNQNVCVFEVKRPAADLTSVKFEKQLFSYMRIIKSNFGILIGKSIKTFTDIDEELELLEEIPFKRDIQEGIRFVELFNKENFNKAQVDAYIKAKRQEVLEANLLQEIQSNINSETNQEFLKWQLKRELLSKYSEDTVNKVMEGLDIQVSYPNRRTVANSPNPSKNQSPKTQERVTFENIIDEEVKYYSLEKPLDLRFTFIKTGLIEHYQGNNWNALLKLVIQEIYKRGLAQMIDLGIPYGLNIRSGDFFKNGFQKILDLDYSIQNVDATKAGKAIYQLAKKYKININIEFEWSADPKSQYPNRKGIIR